MMRSDVNLREPEKILVSLQHRGRASLRIVGMAMFPCIPSGSVVGVQSVSMELLDVGDIIVYHNGNGLLCRRVHRCHKRLIYVRGDASLGSSKPVLPSQIAGRVSHILSPKLHYRVLDSLEEKRRGRRIVRFSTFYSLGMWLWLQLFRRTFSKRGMVLGDWGKDTRRR